MNKKNYEQLIKDFIVDNGTSLPKQIGEILIKHKVQVSKKGDVILLGNFYELSPQKQKKIEYIATKLFDYFEKKKNRFEYRDLIIIRQLEELLIKRSHKTGRKE